MLGTIDILIGFSVVMLAVSMAVTVLTQAITDTLNSRARFLKGGLADLLSLLDRDLKRPDALAIADRLLSNPLVARTTLLGQQRAGSTIHREEFVKLAIDFASTGDATKAAEQAGEKDERLRQQLRRSIEGNDLTTDLGEVLAQVRSTLLTLEHTAPELSASRRSDIALLTAASSEFLAKSYAWFDQTMDRVTDRFTAHARIVTAVSALLVAVALQLDAGLLVNRLSTDDALRTALVRSAIDDPDRFAPGTATAPPSVPEALKAIGDDADLNALVDRNLIEVPTSWTGWRDNWRDRSLFGVLLSALLLSLGGPFWYAILKNLLNLRSLVARKDDRDRNDRQRDVAPVAPADAMKTIPPELAGGERGDPDAVG